MTRPGGAGPGPLHQRSIVMPREFPRTRRVGEQIQREIATLMRDEIVIPDWDWSASPLWRFRAIFRMPRFSFPRLEKQKMPSIPCRCCRCAGYLSKLLGQRLALRHVPQLHFKQDFSLEEGAHLSALIDAAVRSDRGDE